MSSLPRLYPTDLTDVEWHFLEPLIPGIKPGGRPPKWARCAICDGIFYIVRSGCQWRLLRNEEGQMQGAYTRFAPELKMGFKGVLPRRWVV